MDQKTTFSMQLSISNGKKEKKLIALQRQKKLCVMNSICIHDLTKLAKQAVVYLQIPQMKRIYKMPKTNTIFKVEILKALPLGSGMNKICPLTPI